MTKGIILFGVVVGGVVGLYLPQLFGHEGYDVFNLVTALLGAIVGLMVVGWFVHRFGR